MAKRTNRRKTIEEEAEAVAEEAMTDIESDDPDDESTGLSLDFGSEPASEDVFQEGFAKAIALKDAPRFYIKKNSQFLTVKDWPYSWEALQKDYGPGYYQVICKRRSNGWILKQQTEMVGDPNEGKPVIDKEEVEQSQQDNNLAVLGWLQQSQERAEARAREISKQSEGNMASVLQAITQSQAENGRLMMQMMMEASKQTQNLMLALLQGQQNKGPDPMFTLITTLLTKDKPKEGMGFTEVIKLLQDKERDTRSAVEKQFEMIEKKSEALAEIKAAGMAGDGEEKEESLSKTLLKSFAPVFSQMIAGGGQAQALPQPQQQQVDTGIRPAIRAPSGATGQSVQPHTRPEVREVAPARASSQPGRAPVSGPVRSAPQSDAAQPTPAPVAQPTQPEAQQIKDRLFNFVAPDIGAGMLNGVASAVVANQVLHKLEKEGVTRQTVAQAFTVEDFYGYAEQYIPAESINPAKAWLKEFHAAIQKIAVTPIVVPSANATGNGQRSGNEEPPVPVKRSRASGRTGTPARPAAKDL